jgi:hypothetical protein
VDYSLAFAYRLKRVDGTMTIRDVYPIKYYSKEGFIERKLEINEEDLQEIIEDYLQRNIAFDFDEVEIVNNRPMNIWL